MTDNIIETCSSADIPEISALFRKVVAHLHSKGIFQWSEDYPNTDIISRDISLGNQYKLISYGKIAGVISKSYDTHPLFSTVSWSQGTYIYASRLAVLPEYEGRGFGSILMDFIEALAKNNDTVWVRLGAYKPNDLLVNYYKKRGYMIKGELIFPVSDQPFYCMEKQLFS